MRFLTLLLVSLVLGFASQGARAQNLPFNVCNYSPEVIDATVFLRYTCGGDMAEPDKCMQSYGYYRVEKGLCRPLTFVMPGYTDFGGHPSYKAELFVHAKGQQGRVWRGSTVSTCIDNHNGFGWQQRNGGMLTNQGQCVGAGHAWQSDYWPVSNGRIEFN